MANCKILTTIKTVSTGNESDLCAAAKDGDLATLKRDMANTLIECFGFDSVEVVDLQIIKSNEQEEDNG